jgi:hypothetical protein
MKKLVLTIAIVLTMGLNAFAQYDEDKFGIQPWFGSSLLGRDGGSGDPTDEGSPLILPGGHGGTGDEPAPVGSGIAVLVGLGAAYLVSKKRKED